MQIRLSDIRLETVMAALEANGFGTVTTTCEVRRSVESVSIWTDDGPKGPGGYEVGLIRREMSSFAARHEVVIETNRIDQGRLMSLLADISAKNR